MNVVNDVTVIVRYAIVSPIDAMDELVDRVGKVEGAVAQVNEDVTEMKPATGDVRKWKLIGMAALAIVGLGGAALGVSITGLVDQLSTLFSGWASSFSEPPHHD